MAGCLMQAKPRRTETKAELAAIVDIAEDVLQKANGEIERLNAECIRLAGQVSVLREVIKENWPGPGY